MKWLPLPCQTPIYLYYVKRRWLSLIWRRTCNPQIFFNTWYNSVWSRVVTEGTVAVRAPQLMPPCSARNHVKSVLQLAKKSFINRECQNLNFNIFRDLTFCQKISSTYLQVFRLGFIQMAAFLSPLRLNSSRRSLLKIQYLAILGYSYPHPYLITIMSVIKIPPTNFCALYPQSLMVLMDVLPLPLFYHLSMTLSIELCVLYTPMLMTHSTSFNVIYQASFSIAAKLHTKNKETLQSA